MNCNDTDPVVREIPVYLAKSLKDKLSIFQYPLRPAKDGYDKAEFLKTQVKLNNQEVQMDLALDRDSENYDTVTGEHIVMNIEKGGKYDQEDESKIFPNDYMDRIMLKSSRALPKCDNFAVAVYQDGELHLTTLKSILQIRPQFNYLDVNEKRGKDDPRNTGDDDDEDDAPKQVNVSFARNLPDHVKKMREQSFVFQSQNSSEQFIETQYYASTTSKAELTRLDMFCQMTEERASNFSSVTKKQYLDLIAPVVKNDKYNRTETPNTASLNYICTLTDMPLLDHIKILIKHAKVLSFTQLRSIISSEHETHTILKYLQQVAVLVQGNWVVNSELEYPKDTKSSHSGIPAELMCRARDYILLLFTENEYVDRKAISSVIKFPAEEIREILVNLAKHQPKKGWRLIISPNKDFSERYTEIAQRQEMFWEAKKKQLHESMKNQTHTSPRQRRKSNRDSTGSESEERSTSKGKKSLTNMLT